MKGLIQDFLEIARRYHDDNGKPPFAAIVDMDTWRKIYGSMLDYRYPVGELHDDPALIDEKASISQNLHIYDIRIIAHPELAKHSDAEFYMIGEREAEFYNFMVGYVNQYLEPRIRMEVSERLMLEHLRSKP